MCNAKFEKIQEILKIVFCFSNQKSKMQKQIIWWKYNADSYYEQRRPKLTYTIEYTELLSYYLSLCFDTLAFTEKMDWYYLTTY